MKALASELRWRAEQGTLELEKSGLGYQRVPPGYRFSYGHTHKRQEEVYVVLRGSGRTNSLPNTMNWPSARHSDSRTCP